MKNLKLLLTFLIFLFSIVISRAQVGIGNNDPQAALDITSTTDGLLIPRVALISLGNSSPVITPTESELVYNDGTGTLTEKGYYFWDGAKWVKLSAAVAGSSWDILGNTNIVDGTNYIGTGASTNVDVAFRRNNLAAGKIGATSTSYGVGALTSGASTNSTAIGNNALSVSTGSNNVALGQNAGSATTTGTDNVFIGNAAGSAEAGGTSNKLYISNSNTTATTSLIYGDFNSTPKVLRTNSEFQIGDPATTGYKFPTARGANGQTLVSDAVGVLSWAASAAVTNWTILGNTSIVDGTNFIGTGASTDVDVAFRRNNFAAGKIGATSTSFGVGALTSGATTNSTAIGNNALSVSTGNNNVAVGQNALLNCNTTAQWNTAVGVNALRGINSNAAQYNTAVGFEALAGGTGNFSNCVAVGFQALYANTNIGINNTGIGYQAGNNITTGYNNTAIGYQATVPNGANPNQVRIGNGLVSFAGVQVAWTIGSDKRLKSNIKNSELGLDFINKLRPVSYVRNNDINKKTEYGFIAQEVEETLKKAGDKNNGIINIDDKGMYAVRYNDFIPITVKAVQEQQTQIEELQKENAELMKTNAAILKRLEALEKKQKGKD